MSRSASMTGIVVAVDGSAESARAVPIGLALAQRLKVPLSVLTVVRDIRHDGPDRIDELDATLGELPFGIERRIVQADAVATTIAQEADRAIACMATHAAIFDEQGLKGSIAELVINSATGPVLVVGPACTGELAVDRIVVGIDPSHDQAALVAWATRLAYQLDVAVDLVHVDAGDGAALGPKVRRLQPGTDETVAARLIHEADGAMLAVGSHARTGLDRLVRGSVGGAVFGSARQPVLVIGPHAS